MKPCDSFLEYLRVRTGSEYLSELRYDRYSKVKLSAAIKGEEAWEYAEKEWLDACSYIADEQAFSKEDAKQKLLSFLCS